MLITNRWSEYIWDYYLKDQRGVTLIAALKSHFALLDRQYGIKPAVIECDNKLTTQKPAVHRYILGLSIRVNPSPPYTQDLNGGAER